MTLAGTHSTDQGTVLAGFDKNGTFHWLNTTSDGSIICVTNS